MWVWLIALVVAVIAVISYAQYRAQAGTYRPLAGRQPRRREKAETPLGMEATDLDHVARTTRANEALERAHVTWTRGKGGSFAAAAETDIEPGPDDHTYAKWFHRSFMKSKDKT